MNKRTQSGVDVVIGNRREVLHVAPIIHELKRQKTFDVRIITIQQSMSELSEALRLFSLQSDIDWKIRGTTADSGLYLSELGTLLSELWERRKPHWVLNFGHGEQAFSTVMTAFQNQISTANLTDPLRNEVNQNNSRHVSQAIKSISIISELLFTPSVHARNILVHDGINENSIYVVGSTLFDTGALLSSIFTADYFANAFSQTLREDDVRFLMKGKFFVLHVHSESDLAAYSELVRLVRDQHISILPVILFGREISIQRLHSDLESVYSNALLLPKISFRQKLALISRAACVLGRHGETIEECTALGTKSIIFEDLKYGTELLSSGLISAAPQLPEGQVRAILSCLDSSKSTQQDNLYSQTDLNRISSSSKIVQAISNRTNESVQTAKTSLLSRQAG
jgi:UDP-N-acetylglucosamine 2-epimerase (non-hydrolysing)